MPPAWQLTFIEEVSKITTGKLDANAAVEGGQYPFFTCAENVSRISSFSFDTEAVLLAGNGFFGVKWFKGKFDAYQRTYVIEPLVIDGKFLYYMFLSLMPEIVKKSRGSTIKYLRLGDIQDTSFYLPPASEQTRIVDKLEELLSDLDAGVAELKAAQKKLGQYRQSLLKAAVEGVLTAEWRAKNKPTETGAQLLERILIERRARWEAKQLAKFVEQGKTPPKDWQKKYPEPVQPDTSGLPELPEGWVWASVEQLADVISGFAFKSTDFSTTGIPVAKIANIGYGLYVANTDQEYLPDSFMTEHSDFLVRGGDLLIALTRPITNNVLKSCLYPQGIPPALLNQRCALIRACFDNLVGYQFLATRTPQFREAVREGTSETLQPNMSPFALKAISVPLPPLDEILALMDQTFRALESIDSQEDAINISLKQSTAQRQNILRAAFSGQLVPQDPNDEPASVLLERIRAERAAQATRSKPHGRKTKEPA